MGLCFVVNFFIQNNTWQNNTSNYMSLISVENVAHFEIDETYLSWERHYKKKQVEKYKY